MALEGKTVRMGRTANLRLASRFARLMETLILNLILIQILIHKLLLFDINIIVNGLIVEF